MSLKYALRQHALGSDPNAYFATIIPAGTKNLDDVISQMISRGSTVTRAEAIAVLEEYRLAVIDLLLLGFTVTTPMHTYGFSIQGLFNGVQAVFDPALHRLRINVRPGVQLREAARLVTLERASMGRATPDPQHFTDVASGTTNTIATPGGLGILGGLRLKYDEADPAQGVFFIDAAQTATRVAMISRNMPGELHVLIPPGLAPGDYTVEVRAELNDTGVPRTGLLGYTLTVS